MEIKVYVEGPISANNYLVIDEKSNEAILIDCSSSRNEFINAIKKLGVNLKYIFLTHGHFDHILGVDKFKEIFGSEIYMNNKDIEQVELTPYYLENFMGMKAVEIKTSLNNIEDNQVFKFGDIEIKAISTPGHTQGGMSYLIENNLFSGDTLFKGSVGRCDLKGGDFKQIVSSIKDKLFNLPDETVVYSGHGLKSTLSYEKKYNEILNV